LGFISVGSGPVIVWLVRPACSWRFLGRHDTSYWSIH